MKGRVCSSLREAIHETVTQAGMPMKALAAELDWSPSHLSMMTTLGEENARPFPADDAHLIRMMRVTNNLSVLLTMADLLGFEVSPKRDAVPAMVAELKEELRRLVPKIQMVLDLDLAENGNKKRGRP